MLTRMASSQAWKLYRKGQSLELLDPAVASAADAEQVAMCVQIGLLCTQADPKLRPDMKRVVIIFSKKPSVLEEPTRPGIPGSRYRRRSYGTRGSHYSAGESSSTINSATTAASTATTSTTLTMRHEAHQEQHPT
ncbi:hypothetical protein BHE74_00039397 [Ensete ventricosum]|uniref:S-locus receptor kinase C-terminal domain-containing protein n=1 Tax=Ensete ventricosum TaxID=4639 RepID=A0A427A2U0_ENSVE|nr:hypothetical protein B296_00035103 [Ensete ventricosum]RWW54046.1 hypothetical protein BHE74_00039397 [Ensete ventricosum]RZS15065.1 hypothetical protein BHM03_00046844 [Ensete ventricosum]